MLRSRVFLGGQAVSMLGDGLATLAVPLLVLQLTRSPMAAVLASLPGSVGYLAAGLPAGVPADQVDPWLVLYSNPLSPSRTRFSTARSSIARIDRITE
jgi:hypothetical protein